MGFLKMGSESSDSSRAERKSETASSLSSLIDPVKQQSCSESNDFLVVKEVHKSLKWGTYSGGATEHQQQTFFQKAYAKRLQKQSDQEPNLVCTDDRHTDSTVEAKSSFTATTNKATVKMENCEINQPQRDGTQTNIHTDSSKTKTFLDATQSLNKPLVAPTQSSDAQHFTCPVCFNRIRTTDLTTFNQHIDECLSSGVDSTSTLIDLDRHGYKNEHGDEEDVQTPHDVHTHPGSDALQTVKKDLCAQTSTFFIRPHTAGSDKPVSSAQSSLTCPVCNQVQDTHNLTEFNHHVDMCLNQEVLSELREAAPQTGKVKGEVFFVICLC